MTSFPGWDPDLDAAEDARWEAHAEQEREDRIREMAGEGWSRTLPATCRPAGRDEPTRADYLIMAVAIVLIYGTLIGVGIEALT